MSSVCAEQHKFHTSHHLLSSKKTHNLLREVDIPPRKLLTRRTAAHQDLSFSHDMYGTTDSPRFSASDEALLRKFLPYNTGASDDDEDDASDDPYSSDHFRMFEFKVRRCTRSRSHDWTDCPFAHPGEKARRRDPRRYHYSGTVCADYRRGGCSRGDSCEFAHGVFECWLHPARYRTEACKDGKNCKRKVCFFAHTPRQLRILPVNHSRSSSPDEVISPSSGSCKKSIKYLNSANSPSSTHCCLFCRSVTSSPTSTLLGMSHLSPPLSPMSPYGESKCHFSSGLDQRHASAAGMLSYKDVLSELMTSLEAMKFNNMEATSSPVSSPISSAAANYQNTPLVDVSSYNAFAAAAEDQQQQFILSPSTPSPSSAGINFFSRGSSTGNCSRKSLVFDEQNNATEINGGCGPDPDLGWVNDLLM
ncbi:putative transcription factor C3H family [Rosa chinensis]|uniref:Putative transcription factor C3H family n=1 Tax=Rosa chinensis TaxID=74649 RepID=A0A2P6RU25_ROSCH|nr:zinc finger CCCH domain-containing protein 2 [Rosa chinensis]PRQ49938.1 putative transcription factor C3H family [Rosa chinensis]